MGWFVPYFAKILTFGEAEEKRIRFLKVFVCSQKDAGFSDKIISHPFVTLQYEMFPILFC